MRVYQLQTTDTLLIDREDRSPLLEVTDAAPPTECWQLPDTALELVTREEALEEFSEALQAAKLSAPARRTVEKLLAELQG